MADVAVVVFFAVCAGLVMWVGHLVAGMADGGERVADEGPGSR